MKETTNTRLLSIVQLVRQQRNVINVELRPGQHPTRVMKTQTRARNSTWAYLQADRQWPHRHWQTSKMRQRQDVKRPCYVSLLWCNSPQTQPTPGSLGCLKLSSLPLTKLLLHIKQRVMKLQCAYGIHGLPATENTWMNSEIEQTTICTEKEIRKRGTNQFPLVYPADFSITSGSL